MTLANFIFVVFLLLSLGVFVFLFMLMRQIKMQGRLPSEKMTTLAALLFIPALIVFALVFKSIASWRADLQAEQQQIALENFITGVYPPLSKARTTLRADLVQMQALIETVKSMEISHPNQRDLIRRVREQWSHGHVTLYKAYTKTDKEVRRAWIAHNTMDRRDVLLKFSQQAVQIETQIKRAQEAYQKHLYSVQGDMVKSVDQARKLLVATRKPPKSNKQTELNKTLLNSISPIRSDVETTLLNFSSEIDPRLTNDIRTIHELVRVSVQQAAVLRDHLYQNPDLEKPLTKVMNDWQALEKVEKGYLKVIYYALETEYVVQKLGLPSTSASIRAMNQTLLKTVPTIKGQGIVQKRAIDKSYSIKAND